MVTIYIENTKCKLNGLNDDKIANEIDNLLSYNVQSYQFMRKQTGWDGRYRLFNKKSGVFPVGLLTMLENVLKDVFSGFGGGIEAGELVLKEETNHRLLSTGIFARWSREA